MPSTRGTASPSRCTRPKLGPINREWRRRPMPDADPDQGRSAFVTGATGVIGRLVVPELVKRGWRVTAVGRNPAKRAELAAMGAKGVELDMFDAANARRALEGHDVVINLATHMPPSILRTML